MDFTSLSLSGRGGRKQDRAEAGIPAKPATV